MRPCIACRSVAKVDAATRQNAALVEPAAAAADSLKHQSQGLMPSISVHQTSVAAG